MIDERMTSEMVMDLIDSIKDKNTVLVSEMIDSLLDILNSAVAGERASQEAIKMWLGERKITEHYQERYGILPPE